MIEHVIDISLLREIDNKLTFIRENEVDADNFEKDYIQDEANQHSTRVEHPKAILYDPSAEESLKLERLRHLQYLKECLERAWSCGKIALQSQPDTAFIRTLAYNIDPAFFEAYSDEALRTRMAPYRRVTDGVRIRGARNAPPYPIKVPTEMDRFVLEANALQAEVKKGAIHPVELAVFSHFNLARIHPFPDANGRTSRTLQNLILVQHNMPAAIIHEGERRSYNLLFDNAITGYKNRDVVKISEQERQFYMFLADKVNVSLDYILDKCE